MQRWVRECDIATYKDTASTSHSHVNENSNNESAISASASIRPSYAMGSDESIAGMEGISDVERKNRNMSLMLLHAVLGVMEVKTKKTHDTERESLDINSENCVRKEVGYVKSTRYPSFDVSSITKQSRASIQCPQDALLYLQQYINSNKDMKDKSFPILLDSFKDERIKVVSHLPGSERRPPSAYDLNIYSTTPNSVIFEPNLLNEDENSSTTENNTNTKNSRSYCSVPPSVAVSEEPKCYEIPHVPGAFIMTNILRPSECCQLMLAADTMEYTPDAVDGIDNVIWLGDDTIMSPILERCKRFMPDIMPEKHIARSCGRDEQSSCDCIPSKFEGVNARLRLFRYYPGAVYRPHIDGAWPGSGLLSDGTYSDDVFNGTKHSKLTFLIYLNGGFEGGNTTFFLPERDITVADFSDDIRVGTIAARSVCPSQGAVLCFPHGTALNGLVHEGSAVTNGAKYIIRTDALYSVVR